jgi:hypothetical protein
MEKTNQQTVTNIMIFFQKSIPNNIVHHFSLFVIGPVVLVLVKTKIATDVGITVSPRSNFRVPFSTIYDSTVMNHTVPLFSWTSGCSHLLEQDSVDQ